MLRKLVGYAAYMAGTTSVASLITFGVSMLGFKTRSKGAVGDYYTYMLIYGIAQGSMIFGVNATIQRYAADDEENRRRYAKLAYLLFALLLFTTAFVGVGVGMFIKWSYALAIFGIPWVVLWIWAQYILRSQLDYRRESKLVIAGSLGNSMFQLGFLTLTPFEDALIYGDFAALVLSGAMGLYMIPRGLSGNMRTLLRTEVPKDFLRESFSFLVPLWLSGQVFSLNYHITGLFIRTRIGAAGMGAYGVMATLFGFANKPMEFLKSASLPGLVRAKDERDKLYRELLRIFLVVYPILVVGLAAGSPLIFKLTGMEEKWSEVPVMLLIAGAGAPAFALEMVANQYAVALGRPKVQLYGQLTHIIVLFALIYPASELYGIYGVLGAGAIATVAHSLSYTLFLWQLDRASSKTGIRWLVLATIGVVVVGAPIYLVRAHPFNWAFAFVAAAAWVVYMFAVRMVRTEDFRRVWRALDSLRHRRREGAADGHIPAEEMTGVGAMPEELSGRLPSVHGKLPPSAITGVRPAPEGDAGDDED